MTSTRPPSTSVIAGDAPRYGNRRHRRIRFHPDPRRQQVMDRTLRIDRIGERARLRFRAVEQIA